MYQANKKPSYSFHNVAQCLFRVMKKYLKRITHFMGALLHFYRKSFDIFVTNKN